MPNSDNFRNTSQDKPKGLSRREFLTGLFATSTLAAVGTHELLHPKFSEAAPSWLTQEFINRVQNNYTGNIQNQDKYLLEVCKQLGDKSQNLGRAAYHTQEAYLANLNQGSAPQITLKLYRETGVNAIIALNESGNLAVCETSGERNPFPKGALYRVQGNWLKQLHSKYGSGEFVTFDGVVEPFFVPFAQINPQTMEFLPGQHLGQGTVGTHGKPRKDKVLFSNQPLQISDACIRLQDDIAKTIWNASLQGIENNLPIFLARHDPAVGY